MKIMPISSTELYEIRAHLKTFADYQFPGIDAKGKLVDLGFIRYVQERLKGAFGYENAANPRQLEERVVSLLDKVGKHFTKADAKTLVRVARQVGLAPENVESRKAHVKLWAHINPLVTSDLLKDKPSSRPYAILMATFSALGLTAVALKESLEEGSSQSMAESRSRPEADASNQTPSGPIQEPLPAPKSLESSKEAGQLATPHDEKELSNDQPETHAGLSEQPEPPLSAQPDSSPTTHSWTPGSTASSFNHPLPISSTGMSPPPLEPILPSSSLTQRTGQPIIASHTWQIKDVMGPLLLIVMLWGLNKIFKSKIIDVPDNDSKINAPKIIGAPDHDSKINAPKIIDVPDDGNCLLYSIAVGIKLTYQPNNHPDIEAETNAHYTKIQSDLNWNIDSRLLNENLKGKVDLFGDVSDRLRAQAADWLRDNKDKPGVDVAILGSMIDHNERVGQNVEEAQAVELLLREETNNLSKELEDSPQSELLKADHAGKQAHLEAKKREIEEEEKTSAATSQDYIDKVRNNNFFCGTAMIYALSQLYEVPIIVTRNYGKANAAQEPFNPSGSKLPPVKLAHIKDNHFAFLI